MAIEKLDRRHQARTIAALRDLYKRGLLELDPPYQRRSVWNQKFRDFFVETVLLNYPAPPIFLHETIDSNGDVTYAVIDGKQRLATVFDFTDGLFPVADDSILQRLQGESFTQFDSATRKEFWAYEFLVEFVSSTDASVLNSIFDRINRNVARLTRQELRHARFDGRFATAAEGLNDYLQETLPAGVPNIARTSLRQMRDVELTAQLLLLLELGPQSFSQDQLDDAYGARDLEWDNQTRVSGQFRRIVDYLAELYTHSAMAAAHMRRLRNQVDFYSLFGAVSALSGPKKWPTAKTSVQRLEPFMVQVSDENKRRPRSDARRYYEAARSASNDSRQRITRIEIVTKVLGEPVRK